MDNKAAWYTFPKLRPLLVAEKRNKEEEETRRNWEEEKDECWEEETDQSWENKETEIGSGEMETEES